MSHLVGLFCPNDTPLERVRDLAPSGIRVEWVDSNGQLDGQAEVMKDAVAALVTDGSFDVELARLCPRLRLVQTTSAGYDGIDVASLNRMGIQVANNYGGNAPAVAEHTIGLMVSVVRKLVLQFEATRSGDWYGTIGREEWTRPYEIAGKTVGIVGMGHIGRQVARRLQGWDCSIVYYDPIDPPAQLVEQLSLRALSMDELLRESDIVTLHTMLNAQTRGLIGARELKMMKSTAVVINTCRGGVVDEAALIRALRDGEIAGAALDVFEQEPTPRDNPLLTMGNVVVTPHMAGVSVEAFPRNAGFGLQNIARVIRGEELLSVVRPV